MLCSGKNFSFVFLRTFSFSWEMDKNVLLLLVWTWKKLLYFQVFDPPLPAIISGWSFVPEKLRETLNEYDVIDEYEEDSLKKLYPSSLRTFPVHSV